MPYIPRENKLAYMDALAEIQDAFASAEAGDGDLNYVLTQVAVAWLMYHNPPYGYTMRSRVLAAFEGAKMEYYRRVMAPYEDRKREDNGDVFPEEVL